MLLKKIKELGQEVDNQLYRDNRDLKRLPGIAMELLKKFPCFEYSELLEEIGANITNICSQHSPEHSFGDQRYTLYNGNDFIIELNIWQNQLTNLHEHSFTGAFKIICGEALHSQYSFCLHENISTFMHVGELTKKSTEHLTTGDQSIIKMGDEFIHNLIHIKNPTATLIIRSVSNEPTLIYQRDFIGRYLAIYGWYFTKESHNAISWIKTINKLDEPFKGYEEKLLSMLSTLNEVDQLYTIFKTLEYHKEVLLSSIIDMVSDTSGNRPRTLRIIKSMLSHKETFELAGGLRDKIKSDDARALLAVLAEASDHIEAVSLYEQIFNEKTDRLKLTIKTVGLMNSELNAVNDEMCTEIIKALPAIFDPDNAEDENTQKFKSALMNTQLKTLLE